MAKDRKTPRMSDIAEALGISAMTVSRAFRNDAKVNAEQRAKILKRADEMGYIFDRAASEMRTKRTGFVAVTVPSINNRNFADSVRGLTEEIAPYGLEILLGYTDYSTEREEQIIRKLLGRKPEAIVMTGSTHTKATRALLQNADIPIFETWDEPQNPIGYSVGFSNAAAGAIMAEHMIDAGCKKLAFIGCDHDTDFRGEARGRGFMETIKQRGLETDRIIAMGSPPIYAQDGAIAAQKLFDLYPDTDGVMCVADSVAYGVLTECQRRGLSVPDDIAIAGFGAYDLAAVSIPPLTTIDPNAYEIGTLTGTLIKDILRNGASPKKAEHKRTIPKLIPRASTRA